MLKYVYKMKRHFAFPPVEDIDTWKNEYTGKVYQAADAQEAAKQTSKATLSKEGLERRNAFFQGSFRKEKVDRTEENQEAEVIKPTDSRSDMLKNASKYIGSSFHSSEKEFLPKEEKPIPFNRSYTFTRENKAIKEVNLQKDDLQTQEAKETKTVRYKIDGSVPKREEKSSEGFFTASSDQREQNNKLDILTRTASGSQKDFAAFSHFTEEIDVMDLVMDVLSDSRGFESSSTKFATEVVDYAKQLKQEYASQKEVQKQMIGRLQESFNESFDLDLKDNSIVYDTPVHRVAADVQALIQKSSNLEWKNDPLIQERAGLWALHVAAKRTGIPTNNINSSFKKKSVQAFGRLALQLLSTATANQSNRIQRQKEDQENNVVKGTTPSIQKLSQQKFSSSSQKQQLNGSKEISRQGAANRSVSLKIDAETLLKSTDCIEDLQTMQNGIEIDMTADDVLDAFVETLRNDELDLDSAESRMDIFSGSLNASEEEHQVRLKEDKVMKRNTNDHLLKQEKVDFGNNVVFKNDVQKEQEITYVGDKQASSSAVKFRKEAQQQKQNTVHFDFNAESEFNEDKIIEKIIE